jgi:hypothetical protein
VPVPSAENEGRWFDKVRYSKDDGSSDEPPPVQNGAGHLFWIKSERLKLPALFSRRIAEPLDADAAGQTAFHGSFDEIRSEQGERDGHVDLPNAARFLDADFLDCRYRPETTSSSPAAFGDGADQASASLKLFRLGVASRYIMREQDASGFFWRAASAKGL